MFAPTPLLDIAGIGKRLSVIFPEGTPARSYLVREASARTIFTALYMDAVDGTGVMLSPRAVVRMSNEQATLQSDEQRAKFARLTAGSGYAPIGPTWYAENSREQVRDEVLRGGLLAVGAADQDATVPVNSMKGRYFLRRHFASLFVGGDSAFGHEAEAWREDHMSKLALTRVQILQSLTNNGGVEVRLPGGMGRLLSPGTSSLIAKALIETFAPRRFTVPAVLWISDARLQTPWDDLRLMERIGLPIDAKRLLPDLVLANLSEPMRLVFCEIVSTDGPITEARKEALMAMTDAAGFPRDRVSFLSAFEHRDAAPLKKRLCNIAVGSMIWCMNEPTVTMWIGDGGTPVPF